MRIIKPRAGTVLKILVALVGLYLIGFFMSEIVFPYVETDEFKGYIKQLGAWGYVIVIGYTIISHIFAPLSGTPAVFLGVGLYGIHGGMFLLYVASLISATINFLLARKYGRNIVLKFGGKKALSQIDTFASLEGIEAIIIFRTVGISFFDIVSYAAGLTKISYKQYIVITAVFGLIPNLLIQFAFRNTDLTSPEGAVIWLLFLVAAAIGSGALIWQYVKRRKPVIPSRVHK